MDGYEFSLRLDFADERGTVFVTRIAGSVTEVLEEVRSDFPDADVLVLGSFDLKPATFLAW